MKLIKRLSLLSWLSPAGAPHWATWAQVGGPLACPLDAPVWPHPSLKSDIPGYNWPFLTIFDFAIIFHLKNYLLGVIIFSTTSHV